MSRYLSIFAALLLALSAHAAHAQPDFTESFFIQLPEKSSKKEKKALRTCATRFAGALVNTKAFIERNTPEIEEAVSACVEGVGDPEFKRACELAVARSQVDLVFVFDITQTSRGVLVEARGLSPVQNGSIWSDAILDDGSDDPLLAALDVCPRLGSSFLNVHAPDLSGNGTPGGARLEIVDVNPSPLTVLINGQEIGLAPNQFRDLPTGQVELTLQSPGYADHTRLLELTADEMTVLSNIQLEALPAVLAIQSNIEGASIFINGAERGTTQGDAEVELELPGGIVTLRVSRTGFATYSQQLELVSGARMLLDVTLEPISKQADACHTDHTPEDCQIACDGGDIPSCTLLGSMYAKGHSVGRDVDRAVELYDFACGQNDFEACNNLGFLFNHGQGVSQDLDRAHGLFEKACEGGDLNGCNNLGYMYDYGQGITQNHGRALELFSQTCDAGSMGGCTNLGNMYQHARGVDQDLELARDLYNRSCDGGNMGGCNNLAYMYDYGVGVSQDHTVAHGLYKKACNGDNVYACVNLANLYNTGKGVKYNPSKARKFLRKACQGGYQKACDVLATAP